jgi:hypothetical protein
MFRHRIMLVLTGLTLSAALALAEPRFILEYPGGVPQVSITGDYPGSTYAVWRMPADGGAPVLITDQAVLCTGSCHAEDRSAVAGASYLYRFDVTVPTATGASLVSFGPYRATISPALARAVGVYVYPNPGRGPAGVQLHVAGVQADGPVSGEAAVYDLAGRRMRTLLRGTVARGLTTVSWDGRDERGVALRPGVYLVRFAVRGDAAVARIVRQ